MSTQKSQSSQLERDESTVQDVPTLDSRVYGLQREETQMVMEEEENIEEEREEEHEEEHGEEEEENEAEEHDEDDRENVDPPPPHQVSVCYDIVLL